MRIQHRIGARNVVADDELVEVTPENIRLRKIHLDPHERKKAAKAAQAANA